MQSCINDFSNNLLFIFKRHFTTIIQQVKEKKNLITVALGYTYIPQGASVHSEAADGVFIPSIGLDYFRKIHPRWEIGIMTDLELGEYVIFEKDLNRKNALVVAAIASFS